MLYLYDMNMNMNMNIFRSLGAKGPHFSIVGNAFGSDCKIKKDKPSNEMYAC